MQLSATLPTLRLSLHHRRDHAASARPSVTPTIQAKRAGGPQDNAFYTCDCGCEFTAAVSTSVGCPSCGHYQDW